MLTAAIAEIMQARLHTYRRQIKRPEWIRWKLPFFIKQNRELLNIIYQEITTQYPTIDYHNVRHYQAMVRGIEKYMSVENILDN